MNFTIDNLALEVYCEIPMQNLKELKKQLEDQIQELHNKVNIIDQAILISENPTGSGMLDSVAEARRSATSFLEPEEIEKAILKINSDFKNSDVPDELKATCPGRNFSDNAINTALHQLIKAKKLRYVRERKGRRPAIYHKA